MGVWQISLDRITPGDLVQAMALFGILAFPIRVVGFFFQELPRSLVSIQRVDEVLGQPVVDRPEDGDHLPPGPLAVELREVDFAYEPGAPVLRGLSLAVTPGEVVAIVGATGCGKSTLTQLLVGLVDPDRGAVEIGGVPVGRIDRTERTRAVALAFQEAFLFADSVRDNITLGLDLTDDQVVHAATVAQAHHFVERLPHGYDSVLGERGVTLSGGQRQRVALARALVRSPRLLILDDATSAVDPTVEAAILAGLRQALDTTTLVVAHRVSTIMLADRVLFVSEGTVAAEGSHADLLATVPAYESIVRAYEVAA